MRLLPGIGLVLAGLLVPLGAQSNVALDAEATWAAARKAGHSVAMTSMDFFNVTPAGRVRVYADLNETPTPNYEDRGCTGRVYGNTAVVVCTQRGGGGGDATSSTASTPAANRRPAGSTEDRFVRVFRREGDRWMAVFSQGVWIEAQPRPAPPKVDPLPSVRAYAPKDAAERDLLAVNDALTEAFAKADAATYGRHTAPEFTRVNPGGDVADRTAFLKTVAGVTNRRPSLQDEMRIRVYGEVAVLAWKDVPVSADGKAGSATRMSRVYARKDGAWQQIVTISTPSASPASTAFAQSAPPSDWQKTRDTMIRAMFAADAQTWSSHVADDWLIVGADGSVRTKAQRAAEIKAAKPVAVPPTPTDQKVRVYGETVVETYSVTHPDGRVDRTTVVWVRQNGQWRSASVHLSSVAAGQ